MAAGKNPTRAGLMNAARNMNFPRRRRTQTRSLLPGVDTSRRAAPVPDLAGDLVQYQNNVFKPLGNLINGRGA